jgi:hypothetical protein
MGITFPPAGIEVDLNDGPDFYCSTDCSKQGYGSFNHISSPKSQKVSPEYFNLFLRAKGVLAQTVQSACLTKIKNMQ